MKFVVPVGRFLFSLIFFNSIMVHFSDKGIEYAAARGVPLPQLLVPASGVMALLGSLSVIFGYKAKIGAWLIVGFLIPVTFMMHHFWTETDPMHWQIQKTNFMKNISMLGGALLITYFGAGPYSMDAMQKFIRRNVSKEDSK